MSQLPYRMIKLRMVSLEVNGKQIWANAFEND